MKKVILNDRRNFHEITITLVVFMIILGICLIKIAQMSNNCVPGIF